MLASTAYRLPFAFRYSRPPLWGTGVETSVRIALREPETVDAMRPMLQLKLMSFGALCATGALGVLPREGFEPVTALFESARTSGSRIEWLLQDWPGGSDSLPVLASLYAAGDVATSIADIELAGNGVATNERVRWSPAAARRYPAVMSELPFSYRIENEGQEDIALRLRLARAPDERLRKSIEHVLKLWGHAASMGAYGVAPVEPLNCSFLFDDFVELLDEQLTWNLRRFRAHPEALDGLINVCAGLHARVCPILECTID